MKLLSAGALLGNLSTLMNDIKLYTRVDLAPTKKYPRLSFKAVPYPYLKTFTIITQRARERDNIAGGIFNTCFCCNHTGNPVLSELFRRGKACDLQCLNISRLLQQAWVKDHYACSQGSRSEEAIICSRAHCELNGCSRTFSFLLLFTWPCLQMFQILDKGP